MEIQYIRKLTASHMVVEQSEALTGWEEQMIAHVSADGILFAECVRENDRNNLWYDITGKQSLDTVLESTELQYELLCRILTGIYGAVERLENILLRADALLLLPECIFLDYRTEQIYFCYYPGNTKGMPEAFTELMEYLLTRIDHGDEQGVALAYSVYERASRGEGSLKEIKELLCLPYERDESEYDVESDTDTSKNEGDTGAGNDIQDRGNEESIPGEKEDRGNRNQKEGRKNIPETWQISVKRCVEWIRQMLRMKDLGQRKHSLGNPGFFGVKAKTVCRKEWEEQEFVFEPEEEEACRETRPTVLLEQLASPPEGVLRYEGKGACKDLNITGTSYVIGSEPGCEGHIPSTTVSRRHARITRTGDIYFIEDLNSSNGTYVGGEMLNYRTKVSLQKNEIVIFADEKFRFI